MGDEEPQLDAFLRHLQAEVDSASEIVDKREREERLFQLEVAIQEAIIFANRYRELQSQGVNPMMLVHLNLKQLNMFERTCWNSMLLSFLN